MISITDCPAAFQKLGKKLSQNERKVISESLNHKDVNECAQKCVKSKSCIAYAIRKNAAKPIDYNCRQYFKDSKDTDNEVPACKNGNIHAHSNIEFHISIKDKSWPV